MATKEKKLDPQKQVNSVNQKEGELQEKTLVFRSNINFWEYGVNHAIVNWHLADEKEWHAGVLEEDDQEFAWSIWCNNSEAINIIYKVTFGMRSSEEMVTEEITTTDNIISIGLDKLKDKQFVRLVLNNFEADTVALVKVLPNGEGGGKMRSCWLRPKEKGFETLVIDKCDSYDVLIEYYSGYGDPQRVTYHKQNGSCFVVNWPRYVRVGLLHEEHTFEYDIDAVEVGVIYNKTQKTQFFLTHNQRDAYVTFDYEINGNDDKQDVIEVTYTIYRSDGSEEHFDAGAFAGNTKVICLKVLPRSKNEK
jgi:hypothetical protein